MVYVELVQYVVCSRSQRAVAELWLVTGISLATGRCALRMGSWHPIESSFPQKMLRVNRGWIVGETSSKIEYRRCIYFHLPGVACSWYRARILSPVPSVWLGRETTAQQ